jgi:hypothetical protein
MEKNGKNSWFIEQSAVIVNYVGVLFGLLVLALTIIKPVDFEGVFFYLQVEFFLAFYFLLMSIVIGFWFILGMPLDLWNRLKVLFRIKYPHHEDFISIRSPSWRYLLLNLMYIFFGLGLIFVALIVFLMVFKSFWLDMFFLFFIVVSILVVFRYIDHH